MIFRLCIASIALVAFLLADQASVIHAQETKPGAQVPVSIVKPRKLADGVMTVVPPEPHPDETSLGPMDMEFVSKHPELAWVAPDFPNNSPNFNAQSETLLERAKGVTLRHSVYSLEFSFKPLRLVQVNVPNAAGEAQKKLVWYLLYKVRYVGDDLVPEVAPAQNGMPVPSPPTRKYFESVLFAPHFTVQSLSFDERTGKRFDRTYIEQILPLAIPAIARVEKVGKPIYDSVEVCRRLPHSADGSNNELWGVATWANIDPSSDFLAVSIEGLTNAYKIEDDGGIKNFKKKVLQIHFWRPGDPIAAEQDSILLGVPALEDTSRLDYILKQFGLPQRVDYTWTYR